VPDRRTPSVHLGLDLGGTNIKWVVAQCDGEWQVLDSGQVATDADLGPDRVVARLAEVGAQAIARWASVESVGIGVPGLYDPATGATVMLPNLPGEWSGVLMAARVGGELELPTHLINDARAFGLAELRLGAGRGASSMIGLTLGTGIGGVVALEGRVHQGHDGRAGELGHQVLEPDGRRCTCGGRGCLEAYARADRIEELCASATVEEAVARARAGDQRAIAGIAEVARWLGIGIANAIVVLTPDRVVLGGGISAAADLLLDPIRAEIRRRVFTTDPQRVEVVTAQLGTWAGAIGAAIHGAEAATAAAARTEGVQCSPPSAAWFSMIGWRTAAS
jgi:glucokinase